MVILDFDFKSQEDEIVHNLHLVKLKDEKTWDTREVSQKRKWKLLERESLTSLYKYGRSDRRQASGQEGELLYAERETRGYRI